MKQTLDNKLNYEFQGISLKALVPITGDKMIHNFMDEVRMIYANNESYYNMYISYYLEGAIYLTKYGLYLKLGSLLIGNID